VLQLEPPLITPVQLTSQAHRRLPQVRIQSDHHLFYQLLSRRCPLVYRLIPRLLCQRCCLRSQKLPHLCPHWCHRQRLLFSPRHLQLPVVWYIWSKWSVEITVFFNLFLFLFILSCMLRALVWINAVSSIVLNLKLLLYTHTANRMAWECASTPSKYQSWHCK